MDTSGLRASIAKSTTEKPVSSAKKIVCDRFVDFMIFKILYVQSNPLPPEISMLQKLKTKGLSFVKIPVADKVDKLYLKEQLYKLLSVTGIDSTYVKRMVEEYQDDAKSTDIRERLLNLVRTTKDYCISNNIEFLMDDDDLQHVIAED